MKQNNKEKIIELIKSYGNANYNAGTNRMVSFKLCYICYEEAEKILKEIEKLLGG